MKIGEIDIDLMFGWALRLIAPIRLINEQMSKSEALHAFMAKTWSFPLALLLMVDLAAIAFAGLYVVENKEVVAAITMANFLQLFAAPVIIWAFLKMLRAPTAIETVVVAYTPTILFAPIFRALTIAAVAGQYHIAQVIIANSTNLQQAFDYMIKHVSEFGALMPKPIPVLSPLIGGLAEVASLLLSVLACESIAWFGRHDRLRVYIAVCVATTLAGVPGGIIHFAQMALTVKIAGLSGD